MEWDIDDEKKWLSRNVKDKDDRVALVFVNLDDARKWKVIPYITTTSVYSLPMTDHSFHHR